MATVGIVADDNKGVRGNGDVLPKARLYILDIRRLNFVRSYIIEVKVTPRVFLERRQQVSIMAVVVKVETDENPLHWAGSSSLLTFVPARRAGYRPFRAPTGRPFDST